MPAKEWIAVHDGCTILVTTAWIGGAKRYVDGNCLDTNTAFFPLPKTQTPPALSAKVSGKNGEFLVEVYLKALATVKAKICVNGTQIGGDVL